jgi:SAM-dependent methyltransferase
MTWMRVRVVARTTSRERGNQRDSYFHGWLYRTFIDPALVPIRNRVRNWVPDGSSVVDIGCGTGAQLFALSDKVVRGLGVDQSLKQIEHARKQAAKLDNKHIGFLAADAIRLDSAQDGEFDIAVASMVIHEMAMDKRLPVLNEMRRIARQLIVVDWEAPQPTFWRHIGAHSIERLAGAEHYSGFRSFTENGGIPELLKQANLSVLNEQATSKGTMRLWLCA